MEEKIELLVKFIKQQASLFLLDAEEFYPFGTYIDSQNNTVPVGVYLDNDVPESLEIIALLEKRFTDILNKGECKIAAMATDVILKKNGKILNALEITFFETGKNTCKVYYKYVIEDSFVNFF